MGEVDDVNGSTNGHDSKVTGTVVGSNISAAQPARTELTEVSQDEQERAVGITSFVSPGVAGFSCIFKQRYTDFLVNEIPPSGEVLHLTEIASAGEKRGKREKRLREAEQSAGADATALDVNSTVRKQEADDSTKSDELPAKRLKVESAPAEGPDSTAAVDDSDNVKVEVDIQDADRDSLVGIFGQETTTSVLSLYRAVLTHPNRKARDHATIKSEVISSKFARTEAHVAVRKIFNSKLETATLQEEPGRMTIRAAPPRNLNTQNGSRQGGTNVDRDGALQKGKLLWEELGGEYLHFTLYKENKDTMEVLYFLASELKVKVSSFQFAGTKDRRGVTVQKVAIHRVRKERLLGITKSARGWRIGGFEYKKHGLELGELQGNEFVIVLRSSSIEDVSENADLEQRLQSIGAIVRKAAHRLQEKGFINFYGLQRFGSFRTGTHITGMRMLQGDLEGAVDGILLYDPAFLPENVKQGEDSKIPQEDIERADAIRIWRETSNAHKARDRMPRRFQAENAVIQHLGRKKHDRAVQERDWQGALAGIQRGLRLMYVHAYQSFIWNQAAVQRRSVYGDAIVEGDLVVIGEKDDTSNKKGDVVDQDGEVVVHPGADGSLDSTEDAFVRARPLSKDEVDSGKWDIFDIVLPLPGWDVVYPQNAIGKYYEDLMGSEQGGRLDPHQMRRTWKDISLAGSYRKMMARPLDGRMDVEMKAYFGEEQLTETDVDRLTKSQQDSDDTVPDHTNGEASNKQHVAAVLRLQLGRSQYATMALRELTKGGAVSFKPAFSAVR